MLLLLIVFHFYHLRVTRFKLLYISDKAVSIPNLFLVLAQPSLQSVLNKSKANKQNKYRTKSYHKTYCSVLEVRLGL